MTPAGAQMTFCYPPCKMNNTTLCMQTKMHNDGNTFPNYQRELYNPPNAHTTFSYTSSLILEYHILAATPMTLSSISNFNNTAPLHNSNNNYKTMNHIKLWESTSPLGGTPQCPANNSSTKQPHMLGSSPGVP